MGLGHMLTWTQAAACSFLCPAQVAQVSTPCAHHKHGRCRGGSLGNLPVQPHANTPCEFGACSGGRREYPGLREARGGALGKHSANSCQGWLVPCPLYHARRWQQQRLVGASVMGCARQSAWCACRPSVQLMMMACVFCWGTNSATCTSLCWQTVWELPQSCTRGAWHGTHLLFHALISANCAGGADAGGALSLHMEALGHIPQPTTLAYLDNGVVFAGSAMGDSQLLRQAPGPGSVVSWVLARQRHPPPPPPHPFHAGCTARLHASTALLLLWKFWM